SHRRCGVRFLCMDKLGDFISRQKWLGPVESALGAVADTLFLKDIPFGEKVRNFFHGTWFGHPLHPVITDVPLGAWTAATALDVYELATGDDRLARGSDAAVGIGLIGAAGAALTGLNDWNYTYEKPRRVGAMHAVTNIAATACYLGSWWQLKYGCRRAGVTTGFAGFALSMVGAYLGGHLVYNERIGVNHAPEELPEKYVPLMKESELTENRMHKAEADGIPVLVVKRGGRIFVMAEKCSHLGGPLAEGKFDGETVTCPWHGSQFAIADGRILVGPATYAQPCFEVRVRDGQVEVRAPRGMVANPY
ncbi:MAG: Rieske 2Fe-2S domain-containing protein, partial [Verrucomicrobiota bacterium]|nr:Rieske 2Fe-2S domain-containing protein [Verrucomicrobiota bacterium]